jgi:hypothetical protein
MQNLIPLPARILSMNELYVLLIIGVSTSVLVTFSLLLHSGSTDIQSVTHNIGYGKSVYEIELVRNNNQFFDVIVDPGIDKVTKYNEAF